MLRPYLQAERRKGLGPEPLIQKSRLVNDKKTKTKADIGAQCSLTGWTIALGCDLGRAIPPTWSSHSILAQRTDLLCLSGSQLPISSSFFWR
jgi:hypothetical protein